MHLWYIRRTMQSGPGGKIPILHAIFGGACIFFLLLSGLGLGFFLLGNYQSFISRSQFLLLGVIKSAGLFSLLSGIYYSLYLILSAFRKKENGPWSFILAMASISVGAGVLAAAHFILAVTLPVQ